MSASESHRSLADHLTARRLSGRPLVVGIDGRAGSGKTTLAAGLADALGESGIAVCRVSVDDFHNPKRHRYRRGESSPEAYYRDSFDYRAFAEGALRPVFEADRFPVRCQTRLLDLERDEEDVRFQELPGNGVLLAEGVFLLRPELVRYMHVRIFIHADEDVILKRVQRRDLEVLGSLDAVTARYREKYFPGEQLYRDEVAPETLADILVDGNDPGRLRWRAVR